jgi:hypothetical protein
VQLAEHDDDTVLSELIVSVIVHDAPAQQDPKPSPVCTLPLAQTGSVVGHAAKSPSAEDTTPSSFGNKPQTTTNKSHALRDAQKTRCLSSSIIVTTRKLQLTMSRTTAT